MSGRSIKRSQERARAADKKLKESYEAWAECPWNQRLDVGPKPIASASPPQETVPAKARPTIRNSSDVPPTRIEWWLEDFPQPVPTASSSQSACLEMEIEDNYCAAWRVEPTLKKEIENDPIDEDDWLDENEPQVKIGKWACQPIHSEPAYVVLKPVIAASSSASPTPHAEIDIPLCNVKTSTASKDLSRLWTLYDVGDTLGKLDDFDKTGHLLGPWRHKKCCGLNGRLQLHLATKNKFHAVVTDLKKM